MKEIKKSYKKNNKTKERNYDTPKGRPIVKAKTSTSTLTEKPINTFDQENRIGYFQTDEAIESIYVGNLSYTMNKNHIAKLFEPHGKVRYIKVVVDPKTNISKGIAFVQMSNKNETNKAVTELNGKEISGRTLKVSVANKQENYRSKPRKTSLKVATGKKEEQATPAVTSVRRRDRKLGLKTLFNHLGK